MQEEFEKYFEERDINERMALFIPEYARFKEQKVCIVGCCDSARR